ncbi:hypothetical protein BHM03_00050449 [Ensete ventricosum]|nr:hypothetical protein BHM03_00050449 [Ensete ventricosum]
MASHQNSQDGNTWCQVENTPPTSAFVHEQPQGSRRGSLLSTPKWSAKRWFNPTRCRLPGDPHERPGANYPMTHAYDIAQSYRVK